MLVPVLLVAVEVLLFVDEEVFVLVEVVLTHVRSLGLGPIQLAMYSTSLHASHAAHARLLGVGPSQLVM